MTDEPRVLVPTPTGGYAYGHVVDEEWDASIGHLGRILTVKTDAGPRLRKREDRVMPA